MPNRAELASRLPIPGALAFRLERLARQRGYRSPLWDTPAHWQLCNRVLKFGEPRLAVDAAATDYFWLTHLVNEDQCEVEGPMPPNHQLVGTAVLGPPAALLERYREHAGFASRRWHARAGDASRVSARSILARPEMIPSWVVNDDELHHRTWRGMRLDRYASELEAALARIRELDASAPRVWVAGSDLVSGARRLVDGAPDVAMVHVASDRVFVHASAVEPLVAPEATTTVKCSGQC